MTPRESPTDADLGSPFGSLLGGSARRCIVGLGNPGKRYAETRHNIGFLVADAFRRRAGLPEPKVQEQALCSLGRVSAASLDSDERSGMRSLVSGGPVSGDPVSGGPGPVSFEVLLVQPQTYMNRSGAAVAALLGERIADGTRGAESAGQDTDGADDSDTEGEMVKSSPPAPDWRGRLLVVYDDLDLPLGKLRYRGKGSSGGHRGLQSIIESLGTERVDRLKVGIGRDSGVDAADYVLEPVTGEEREQLYAVAAHAADTLPVWLAAGGAECANRFNGSAGEFSGAGGKGTGETEP